MTQAYPFDILIKGDSLQVLPTLPSNYIDAIVADPPAGIAFMGQSFDSDRGGRDAWVAWLTAIMVEAYRVLKPGGHAVVWALPRTSHWTAWALENAGFELRDCLTHCFGCLSEDTEIYTLNKGWIHYQKCEIGDLALGYNVDTEAFTWQTVEHVHIYPYSDTAYRIQSDSTDQIVSRNHRCIIERGGRKVFEYAEALEHQVSVPILESLPAVQGSIPDSQSVSGKGQQLLFSGMQSLEAEYGQERKAKVASSSLSGMQQGVHAEKSSKFEQSQILLKTLLWDSKGSRSNTLGSDENRWSVGTNGVDGRIVSLLQRKDEWSEQPSLEGRCQDRKIERELFRIEICSVPQSFPRNGEEGRMGGGTSACRSTAVGQMPEAIGSCTSHRPQPDEQRSIQPDAVQVKQRSQAVGMGQPSCETTLASVTPIDYRGNVWCVTVSTGAFVARRNGKIFVTGNSGMPKSLNVSKAIDKKKGAKREVIGTAMSGTTAGMQVIGESGIKGGEYEITKSATLEAQAWEGYGTCLKPASEHWILCRKPLERNVIENCLQYGTGALNLDACRVKLTQYDLEEYIPGHYKAGIEYSQPKSDTNWFLHGSETGKQYQVFNPSGRFPPNLLLSHCPECQCLGEKKVKGSHDANGKRQNAGTNSYGMITKQEIFFPSLHTAPDGTEIVSNYACVQGCPQCGTAWCGTELMECETCNVMAVWACPVAAMDAQSGRTRSVQNTASDGRRYSGSQVYMPKLPGERHPDNSYSDEGGASRFFPVFHEPFVYATKAPRNDRTSGGKVNNVHPTVKGQALMRWLCRLVTPYGGIILDPFAGSGSTALAAIAEGFHYVCIEEDETYYQIAKERLLGATGGFPDGFVSQVVAPVMRVAPKKDDGMEQLSLFEVLG